MQNCKVIKNYGSYLIGKGVQFFKLLFIEIIFKSFSVVLLSMTEVNLRSLRAILRDKQTEQHEEKKSPIEIIATDIAILNTGITNPTQRASLILSMFFPTNLQLN